MTHDVYPGVKYLIKAGHSYEAQNSVLVFTTSIHRIHQNIYLCGAQRDILGLEPVVPHSHSHSVSVSRSACRGGSAACWRDTAFNFLCCLNIKGALCNLMINCLCHIRLGSNSTVPIFLRLGLWRESASGKKRTLKYFWIRPLLHGNKLDGIQISNVKSSVV